jgi:hypothetical protein
MITIKKVETKKELTQFIDFPHDLYKDNPFYVPELFMSQKALLDKKKSNFHKHSKADYFLALKDGKIAGRIAAIRNNNHIEFTGEQVGFFGFFDVINDYRVAEMLLDTAKDWIKSEGLTAVFGPENYSGNETCGSLIEGFDSSPVAMMTYNFPYYNEFLEKYGFTKAMDLLAYRLDTDTMPEKLIQVSKLLENRLKQHDIVIRNLNMKDWDKELIGFRKVYNEAWQQNWGFVPMTDAEFSAMCDELKMIVIPDFVFIAEKNGEMIGISATIPDIYQIFKHIPRGRLFPFGLFKYLYYRKKIDIVRVIILGVLNEHRRLGLDAVFYAKTVEMARKYKIKFGEASWILENNEMMNKALVNIGGYVYKKYRIFRKDI